jgi:hypothetical protein
VTAADKLHIILDLEEDEEEKNYYRHYTSENGQSPIIHMSKKITRSHLTTLILWTKLYWFEIGGNVSEAACHPLIIFLRSVLTVVSRVKAVGEID